MVGSRSNIVGLLECGEGSIRSTRACFAPCGIGDVSDGRTILAAHRIQSLHERVVVIRGEGDVGGLLYPQDVSNVHATDPTMIPFDLLMQRISTVIYDPWQPQFRILSHHSPPSSRYRRPEAHHRNAHTIKTTAANPTYVIMATSEIWSVPMVCHRPSASHG